MKIFILLGPPGVGKGTNAKPLCKNFGFVQYSTGQVFREEIAAQSPLGLKVKEYLDSGALVPDDIVVEVAAGYLAQKKAEGCSGVLLDGFPRTVPQAEALEKTLSSLNLPLTGAILLDADEGLLVRRLTGRRVCRGCDATYHVVRIPPKVEGVCDVCSGELYQRKDDHPDTVKDRLKVYHELTEPLIEFYESRNALERTDLNGDVADDYRQVTAAMGIGSTQQ